MVLPTFRFGIQQNSGHERYQDKLTFRHGCTLGLNVSINAWPRRSFCSSVCMFWQLSIMTLFQLVLIWLDSVMFERKKLLRRYSQSPEKRLYFLRFLCLFYLHLIQDHSVGPNSESCMKNLQMWDKWNVGKEYPLFTPWLKIARKPMVSKCNFPYAARQGSISVRNTAQNATPMKSGIFVHQSIILAALQLWFICISFIPR